MSIIDHDAAQRDHRHHREPLERIADDFSELRADVHRMAQSVHILVRRQLGNMTAEEETAAAARIIALGKDLDKASEKLQAAVDAAEPNS